MEEQPPCTPSDTRRIFPDGETLRIIRRNRGLQFPMSKLQFWGFLVLFLVFVDFALINIFDDLPKWSIIAFSISGGLLFVGAFFASIIDPASADKDSDKPIVPPHSESHPPSPVVGNFKYCQYCQEYTLSDAKHCRYCNKCVVNYDHHCFWLNTCISNRNYKSFFVSILGVLALTALGIFIPLTRIVVNRGWADGDVPGWCGFISEIVLLILCLPVFFSDVELVFLHVYLCWKGQSSYIFIRDHVGVTTKQNPTMPVADNKQKKLSSVSMPSCNCLLGLCASILMDCYKECKKKGPVEFVTNIKNNPI